MSLKSRRNWITLALIMGGCAGANPFVAARFAGGLVGSGAGGGATQPTSPTIRNSCDLGSDRKTIVFALANRSTLVVQYSLVFIATAGTGGFVCDEDLASYQRAGYRPTQPNGPNRTLQVGCDPVPLSRGTQFLVLELSGQIAADNTGGTGAPPLAASPLNGSVRIPTPEVIVLGTTSSTDVAFVCQGNSPCSQGGFLYRDISGNLIRKVTASRTQGTVCQTNVSNLPEWRLLDPNSPDASASAFQYVSGGGIAVIVLDRANNTNPNDNQVVWDVVDRNGNEIHAPNPPP